ncbi:MAG TPA: hypothetical protein VI389_03690 [Geobacteraceae bacterium]
MTDSGTETDLVSVERAAQELASTRLKVLMLIKGEVLVGVMATGEWYVTRQSLDILKARGIPEEKNCRTACSSTCGGCH